MESQTKTDFRGLVVGCWSQERSESNVLFRYHISVARVVLWPGGHAMPEVVAENNFKKSEIRGCS